MSGKKKLVNSDSLTQKEIFILIIYLIGVIVKINVIN